VRKLDTRVRWAVPAGAIAAVGIAVGATAMASAAVPSLPHRTAAQLIAEVSQAASKPQGPFTATVQESANLGLPQLPQAAQPSGAAGIASGTQTATIWYADPQHIRISKPVQAGESDLRLNGRTLWLWDSKTQTATKVTLPAHATGVPGQAGNGAAAPSCPPATASAACAPLSPMAAATQILKALGPSTVVAVESNVQAPTGPAYQLALKPRTSQSLIGKVVIAIDASSHLPVSVAVFGRGSTGLVYSVGLTSLTLGTPGASNFTFTPPPGATVKTQVVPSTLKGALPPGLNLAGLNLAGLNLAGLNLGGLNLGGMPGVHVGSVAAGSLPVSLLTPAPLKPGQVPMIPIPKQALAPINAKFAASLPASMSKAQRAAAIKQFDSHFKVVSGSAANNGGGFVNFANSPVPVTPTVGGPNVKVIGKDWLSVVATPANPNVAAAVQGLLSGKGPTAAPSTSGFFGSSSSSSTAYSSTLTVQGPPGANLAVLRALLLATTPVRGRWGSGRLLETNVVSVLITSKGQILAGAVTPAVLYADVPAVG
jgi:outer membrane lipoprotein-sorting protein